MELDNQQQRKLMFQPFSSKLSPGFWHQLTSIKLNKLKLSKGPVDIAGTYSCNLSEKLPIPSLASFDHSSFNDANQQMELANKSTCCLYGKLICTNIIQEFNDCVSNKKELIQQFGSDIWKSILNGDALKEPEKYLSKVSLLVYADLKKYKFVYYFCFPALNYLENVSLLPSSNLNKFQDTNAPFTQILNVFSEESLQKLQFTYDKQDNERKFSRAYFIVKHIKNNKTKTDDISIHPLSEYYLSIKESNPIENEDVESDIYFAFSDPSSSPSYPGWPLRNYLTLIAYQFELKHVKVIRLRKGNPSGRSKLELHHSMLLEVSLQVPPKEKQSAEVIPITTGWELDGKTGGKPKRADLSNHLDPKKLAEDAVNLNLRLMKWRLLPGLDLDKIAATKCLLLGCGTLGCHIARGLLAWGITNLSIVDNSKISYSNPVRQSLYTFEDCVSAAKSQDGEEVFSASTASANYKAITAKSSLLKIHPTANIQSYVFSIPMPGHHVDEKELEQTKKDVKLLEDLIDQHDVIFLLMDTRESRWLPTVISISKQKLVINAAIGFDTFLLQRYGIRSYHDPSSKVVNISNLASSDYGLAEKQTLTDSGSYTTTSMPSTSQDSHSLESGGRQEDIKTTPNFLESDKLGCYFCNDIVAPGDSTLDRTLDQQCTVSRPGVSMMVSAMAVELLASIMSSRKLAHTPAPLEVSHNEPSSLSDEFESELGIVPHSIRGSLARYHIYMPTSPAFEKCSACSKPVVNAYKESGFDFLQKVFDDPGYLEEIAGLKDLQNVSDHVWALESDEEADDSFGHLVERKQ